ncbi:uncharacterized protein FFMR_12365 [Fusarium fujikuroi]|nr:uncharacterized protein FFMR_12365 [Fusarium fujikuroi]
MSLIYNKHFRLYAFSL